MNILETLFGSPGKQGSTFNPNQISSLNDILQSVKGMRGGTQDITQNQGYQSGQNWLNNLFNDPGFFQSFEAPLQRDFQEQTIPNLANRFASMGSGGSLGSTAFRNALGRESSNLHTNIGALRGGLQQQGTNQALQYAQQPFQNLMQLYQQALQPTQNTYSQPTGGLFGPLLGALGGGAAAGYGQKWGQNMYGDNNNQGQTPGQFPGTY
jgi:hypothetical protein